MRSNYKRIGDCIRLVDERNVNLSVPTLLGLSILKEFIPSVANIIGTDMKNYKIIRKNQFACSTMQVRRDKKMPIALLENIEEAIISAAYPVFEVIDTEIILPEYLMMWFRRSEFDREACFYAIGGVRGSIEWEDFCNMKLPVPSIAKQKEIVKEYNVLANRINMNNRLIQKLEETAQTIYRQWFIDFEFLNGSDEPYKSSGGEMEFNNDLDKEIPKGWKVEKLGDLIESASKKHDFNKEELIFFNTSDILNGEFLHNNYSPVDKMPGQAKKQIKKNDILYSEIRPENKRFALVRVDAEDYVVSTKLMVLRRTQNVLSTLRIYHYVTQVDFISVLQQSANGRSGTFPQITFDEDIINKPFIIGDKLTESKWENFLGAYYNQLYSRKDENQKLKEMCSILLSKLATNGGSL